MENIFTAFPKILGQIDDNAEALEAFAFAAWRRSVGELINEQTSPVALSDSRLRVAVSNETWRRHLIDMAGEILFKLNSNLALSSVTFLEFFVDEKAVAEDRLAHPTKRSGAARETEVDEGTMNDLSGVAIAIENEELRKTFLRAAGSCLARTERNLGRK